MVTVRCLKPTECARPFLPVSSGAFVMPQNCNPGHFERLNRRGFLSVGVLAGAGLTLPQLLRSNAAYGDLKNYKNFEGTAKSVIHIYLPGGMAHQESFDPKPNAPIEYRGEMKQVATKISGELF